MDYKWAWQIVAIIVILLAIIWIYSGRYNFQVEDLMDNKKSTIQNEIRWLYTAINDILHTANINVEYEIYESNQLTCSSVINNKIYIGCVLWNDEYDRIYNYNTAIYAILCELSNNLGLMRNTSIEEFKQRLIRTAINMHYYDETINVERGYPLLN